ncbi:MAG TPA: S41 family peptidase [Candidatus Paceibacterota bacterium]|nr:S41 family peptidase [Candidatus Paceibacterota bacterium]
MPSSSYSRYFAKAFVVLAIFAGGVWSAPFFRTSAAPICATNTVSDVEADFAPFWDAWAILEEKYGGETVPSEQEKIWGAISGLAASYNDPYTVFFPPVESKNFESDIAGNFEGVGMEIGIRNDALVVIAPLKDTPAFRAGIMAGDKILRIGTTTTAGLSVDKAVKLIRGPRGTQVTLLLSRDGISQPFEKTITRAQIDIPTVRTEMRKDGVFVISLYNFSAPSMGLFRNALREFVGSGTDKLILDLRNNPGGYLEASVDMASWFLPPGKVVVREDFGKGRAEQVYRSRGYDIFTDQLKFAILINGGSASASEILAGALQAHKKAVLVGEKTFGKGSVQELVKLTPDTSLKVTIARWLTPNGLSISENGLTPDVTVSLATTTPKGQAPVDTQMEKAAALLKAR